MKETEMGGNLIGHGKDEIARRLVILVGKQEQMKRYNININYKGIKCQTVYDFWQIQRRDQWEILLKTVMNFRIQYSWKSPDYQHSRRAYFTDIRFAKIRKGDLNP